MKFFKTVKGAFNYVKRNAETGNEKTVNEILCFGMGVYAYCDVLTFSRVKDCTRMNNTFAHLTDEEALRLLAWLQKTDGYLCVQ